MKHFARNSLLLLLIMSLLTGTFCLPGYADSEDALICADYYARCCENDPAFGESFAETDVVVERNYGRYDGGTVVLMDVAGMQMTTDILTLEIAGHLFEFNSGARLDMFLVWKDGAFTRVREAYLTGQLSKADIDAVWANYCKTHEASEPAFADVQADAWYADSVDVCAFYAWMYGYDDGAFHPDDTMTRAMFVSVLYRMENDEEFLAHKDEYERPFDDVPEDEWYADAALWAGVKGIVKGTADGVFSPNAALTREQAATILARYAQICLGMNTVPQGKVVFPDAAKIADWALPSMQWLKQTGVLSGDENGNAMPKNKLSRAQCAVLLVKLHDYAERVEYLPEPAIRELTAGFTADVDEFALPATTAADRTALLNFCATMAKNTLGAKNSDIISPISALYALGMTANGAKNQTLSQLEGAIGIPTDRLNAYLYTYGKLLTGDENGKVQLADSVWINKQNSFTVNPDYLQSLVDYYDAQAYYGAFDDTLLAALNDWVNGRTYGMIPQLLDRINPDAALYLVNTLAVQLEWSERYTGSRDGMFTAANGAKQACQMLYGEEHSYLHDENTTGFMKRYANGYSFVALLPDEGISMEDYLGSLSGEKLAKLLDNPETNCAVYTCMPEFQTDSSFELMDPLKQMGVADLFDPNAADLSGMGCSWLYVSRILQKATITLDKDGTSAAAATVVEVAEGAVPFENVYNVNLDRPFVYMIVDPQSQLPLFIGVVNSVG